VGLYAGKRVTVLGLGASGAAAARLCVREGARVVGTDTRTVAELGPVAAELSALGVELVLGGHRVEDFTGADLVVKSPGVKPSVPVIAAAREAGVRIIGEVELCAPFLKGPVVAITGTNGKSTTTALVGHLLETAGLKTFVGGNLGTPVAAHVMSGERVEATVLELSSYQIDDLDSFRCDVALVLNLTPDHLERYGTMERYAASKARLLSLVRDGGVAVVNGVDTWTRAMPAPERVMRVPFGVEGSSLVVRDGEIHRKSSKGLERYVVRARSLRGAHNLENAMAAIEAARLLGASPAAVQRGLETYPGLAHRIESVRMLDGVEWVNDSKATNVDSVEKSLAAFAGPLHLIAGGLGKGAPYAPLRPLLPGRVVRLYVIGDDAGRLEAELGDLVPVEDCGDLQTAVARARIHAKAGDTVLLSPACASFDQFRSFEHRGGVFCEAVRALGEGR
jgi:UDP-N-acetylmuramoylalanine--D-glutamate ligase